MSNPTVVKLNRTVYTLPEASRLLGLRVDRARVWLDGGQLRGVAYPPLIREVPTGDDLVTWGEFVELAYLRALRRKRVPLNRLRPLIDQLRTQFQTPYPLATAHPYVHDLGMVFALQETLGIPASMAIVIRSGQTLAHADEARRFLTRVEFHPVDGGVIRLYPAGPASPVTIDPLVRFGRPTVEGVATERLWELFDAGETVDEIAAGYDLPSIGVGAGIAYEEQLRTLAA